MNDIDETFDEARARWKREQDARAEASRLFNPGAVDRVETAVGKPLLDRDGFADELEHLARIHSTWHDANDRPPDGATERWLVAVGNDLRRAGHRLANPPDGDQDLLRKLMINRDVDPDDIGKLRLVFDGIPFAATKVRELLEFYVRGRIESRSAESWLIGEALPGAYTQHFGDIFGHSRDKDSGVPSGPGIRFILEVLSIMKVTTPRDGKPFGPDAIEYYLRTAQHRT
jgi:hypothetical protein